MDARDLKNIAATKALEFVENGMRLGIGTGSTAEAFIHLLADKISQSFKVYPVTTSTRSENLCWKLGIKTYTLDDIPKLDLTIDGADEIGAGLTLIKGGGGALLREKIVAFASETVLIIADERKIVQKLGAFPLPIEVNIFGLKATQKALAELFLQMGLKVKLKLRMQEDSIFITDGEHAIIDAYLEEIEDTHFLSAQLLKIPGVVEHGLFIDLAEKAIIAMQNGEVRIMEKDFYTL